MVKTSINYMKTINKALIHINKDIFTELIPRFNNGNISIIIPNICNTNCTFTPGFGKKLALNFPETEKNYLMLGKSFTTKNPGYVQYVNLNINKNIQNKNSIIIANMICGHHSRPNKKINYGHLAICMYKIKQYASELCNHNYEDSNIEIHMSRINNSIVGSDWKFIENLIDDIWLDKFNIFIYSVANLMKNATHT